LRYSAESSRQSLSLQFDFEQRSHLQTDEATSRSKEGCSMPFRVITPRRFVSVCVAMACCLTGSLSHAQLPQTRLLAVFPQGAQSGQSVEVTVANGTDLDELDRMTFSHSGIKAKLKSGSTFTVTVAANVPVGTYEARVHGLYGTSNPRCFVVGALPEVLEIDANNTQEAAQVVEVGTVINGRSNRGADVDFYKVMGKKGQRLLIECQALRIDSKFQAELRLYSQSGRRIGRSIARFRTQDPILDVTFPEDGDYFIRATDFVYGGSNDYGYRLKIHTGPHVDFVIPPAGVPGSKARYTLVGRNLPGSQPAGIGADGRQLEKLDVEITLPNKPEELTPGRTAFSFESSLDGSSYVYQGATGSANPVRIAFAPQPLKLEVEPNNAPTEAQKIVVPGEIAGQLQQRADVDTFEFDAKAGQAFWIDVFGHQLGHLTDPYLTVEQITKKDDGTETVKRLTVQDDTTTNAIANLFDTLNNDPSYRLAIPADGLYRVTVRDRYWESRGSPNLQYHLAIRPEEHDFRLVVIPAAPVQNATTVIQTWAPGLRRGESLHVKVAAIRKHGFKGVIDVLAKGLPPGVTCRGVSIDGSLSSTDLVFTVSDDAKPGDHSIQLIGNARAESDVAVKAVAVAEAALTKAQAALPALDAALQKTIDPRTKAEVARKAAETTATTDAAALKTATAAKVAADKQVVDAQNVAKVAVTEKDTADKAVVAATAAVAKADTDLKAAQAELDKDKENQTLKDKVTAATAAKGEADKTLTTAQATATAAATKVTQTEAVAKQSVAEATKAQQEVAKADQKVKQSATAMAAAVKAHEATVAAFQKAEAAKKAGEAAVVSATTDVAAKKKAREAAVRMISHGVRSGTVVWNGTNTKAAVSRVSEKMVLSIMEESAPYQVSANVEPAVLGHNRQLMIPVKLAKRNGFDNKVQLTFQNVPKNLQVQNLAIEKGKDQALLRVFVPTTVAEGTYTLFLQAQGQVSYQKNLIRLERATAAQKAADEVLKAATTAAATAKTAADAGTKTLTDSTNAQKAAQQKVDAATKVLTTAQTAEKTVSTAKAAADKAAADAQAKLTQVTTAAEAAKAASEKDKENQELVKQLTAAQKAQTDSQTAFNAAQKAVADVAAKVAAAQKVTATAAQASVAATKALTDAQAAVAAATEAKKVSDTAKVAADAKVKTDTAAKTASDNELKAATAYSKAANINVFAPSTPIVIRVRKGVFTLTVSGGGDLKRGQQTDVKVTLKREKGFTGPVTVGLAVPHGTAGLSAPPVTIAADQTEAVLKVSAAADATEGDIANLVVRGSAESDGPISADQTVKLKVVK
jgi:hypothetical protein